MPWQDSIFIYFARYLMDLFMLKTLGLSSFYPDTSSPWIIYWIVSFIFIQFSVSGISIFRYSSSSSHLIFLSPFLLFNVFLPSYSGFYKISTILFSKSYIKLMTCIIIFSKTILVSILLIFHLLQHSILALWIQNHLLTDSSWNRLNFFLA